MAQARNEADTLVYQAEKALRDLGDRVPGNDRATIEQQIQTVKDATQTEDVNAIRSASQALQNATYALSQQANATDTSAAYGGSAYGSQRQPEGGDDVVEGDFTEV